MQLKCIWCIYQRRGRARSGCGRRADRTGPRPAGGSARGGSAAAAPGPAGRLRPGSARARGARGGNLRGREHSWDRGVLLAGRTQLPALTTAAADLPTAPRLGEPRLLYQPSNRGTSRATSARDSVQAHRRDFVGTIFLSTSGELSKVNVRLATVAVYSRSPTTSTKPTTAHTLQARLRKSIDARDGPQRSPVPSAEKSSWQLHTG